MDNNHKDKVMLNTFLQKNFEEIYKTTEKIRKLNEKRNSLHGGFLNEFRSHYDKFNVLNERLCLLLDSRKFLLQYRIR